MGEHPAPCLRNTQTWTSAYWPKESFQPPRFRAPVLLFKRLRQPYYYVRGREMGWGTRSEGGVEICEIHCQHIEVLRLPYVQIIGQKLASRLQRIKRPPNAIELGGYA